MSRIHFPALHGLRASSGGGTQMLRNLIGISLVIALFGLSVCAQEPSATTTPAQAPQLTAPGPRRQQPPSGRPQGSDQRAPITNADVVRMVKADVPESAIITSTQSSPVKFDLSPDGLLVLHRAGVDQKILEAMMAEGGIRPDSTTPAKGLASDGRSLARNAGASSALKVKLGPPKTGERVRNPRAAESNASITAVLQKQRQVADVEAAQMKLGIRRQGQQGTLAVQSQSTSTITDGNKSGLVAVQSQTMSAAGNAARVTGAQLQSTPAVNGGSKNTQAHPPAATRGDMASARTAVTAQSTPAPVMIGPSQTSGAPGGTLMGTGTAVTAQSVPSPVTPSPSLNPGSSGNSPATRYTAQPLQNMTAITCTYNPTLRILTVSGSQQGAILSADSNYNLYTITGCSFGSPGPNNKAWIYAPGLHVDLQIQHWDDNQMAWMFDPQLRGVTDNNDVHLVLQRADGKQLDTGGYKFYAARDTVVLGGIPALTTNVFTAARGGHFHLGFSTPANDAGGYFAEVSRWVKANKDRPSGNVFIDGNFVVNEKTGDFYFLQPYVDTISGTDYFDFGKLSPGFVTDAFQLMNWQTDPSSLCGGEADTLSAGGQTLGNWNAQWDGNNIRVASWATTDCDDLEVFVETFVKQSQYALQVWVTGPRGIDPWTGNALRLSQ
jgi:hypothetical protein